MSLQENCFLKVKNDYLNFLNNEAIYNKSKSSKIKNLKKIYIPISFWINNKCKKKGYKYQKVGIILLGLNDVDVYKKNLFSSINSEEKRTKLMKAIDYTNIKYGRHTLSIAQAGLKKRWNIKRQHSSKIDTTCFDFLPIVKVA